MFLYPQTEALTEAQKLEELEYFTRISVLGSVTIKVKDGVVEAIPDCYATTIGHSDEDYKEWDKFLIELQNHYNSLKSKQ